MLASRAKQGTWGTGLHVMGGRGACCPAWLAGPTKWLGGRGAGSPDFGGQGWIGRCWRERRMRPPPPCWCGCTCCWCWCWCWCTCCPAVLLLPDCVLLGVVVLLRRDGAAMVMSPQLDSVSAAGLLLDPVGGCTGGLRPRARLPPTVPWLSSACIKGVDGGARMRGRGGARAGLAGAARAAAVHCRPSTRELRPLASCPPPGAALGLCQHPDSTRECRAEERRKDIWLRRSRRRAPSQTSMRSTLLTITRTAEPKNSRAQLT